MEAVAGGLTEAWAALEEAAVCWLWGGFWNAGCWFASKAQDQEARLKEQ